MATGNAPNVPRRVIDLVERFGEHESDYKSGRYNETETRRDFIDPLFEAMGWDVQNRKGYALRYREVVHEDSVRVAGRPKSPDYCFRVGGMRKFFVEAKRPSVDLRLDAAPAYQLRRYAYSAGLPLSILTDFEEFSVYDTRIKPKSTDSATTGRIRYWTYRDYPDCFGEIVGVFSKEAIQRGAFERFAEDRSDKRGASEVDSEFLAMIEGWRERLARSIARHNLQLSVWELNEVVQRIIDRIIFLRIAEDRDSEEYGRLRSCLEARAVPGAVSAHLYRQFRLANDKYNSSLFAPLPLFDGLVVDDAVLVSLIGGLYYPECPYELSVMPVEILGTIYERFLGKVIRLTEGHRARVEEKPEVRKAGGVYYTPHYIVDWIVGATVGAMPIGDGRLPRIVDPACGSGSFLLGAYRSLLDRHVAHYSEGERRAKALREGRIYQVGEEDWRLTIEEKRRILQGSIFGVDIDPQAVEVTRLSLLLKLMEDENRESIDQLLRYSDMKPLPDLSATIRCGNSLIGSDFYQGEQLELLADEESQRRINAFDWREGFTEVFAEGGFDCVIGNPPYVRQETLGAGFKRYAAERYRCYHGVADLYVYFIERGMGLLREGGRFGYIVSNKWLRAKYGEGLRRWLAEHGVVDLIDFGDLPVFKQATTYPCLLIIEKSASSDRFRVAKIANLDFVDATGLQAQVEASSFTVSRSSLRPGGWLLVNDRVRGLIERLNAENVPLGEYVGGRIFYGVKTGLNEAFVIDEATRDALVAADPRSAEVIRPFLLGRDIKRYHSLSSTNYLLFFPKGFTRSHTGRRGAWQWLRGSYPAVAEHLSPFEKRARKRHDKGDFWWELRSCDYYAEFEKPKICWGNLAAEPPFSYDSSKSIVNAPGCILVMDGLSNESLTLLALINSKLLWWYLRSIAAERRGGFIEAKPIYVSQLPIHRIDSDSPLRSQIISLVERIMQAQTALQGVRSDHDRRLAEQRVTILDREIDRLVYEVYGLGEREIGLVEG